MTMRIFGFYPSEQEAITVVNSLGLKGFRTKDITILTTHSSATSLQKYTDANVCSNVPEQQIKKTFYKQIKEMFVKKPDKQGDFNYTLKKLGFNERTIEKCLKKIGEGNVLVVIDDFMKLGHSTINDIIRPNLFNENDHHAG